MADDRTLRTHVALFSVAHGIGVIAPLLTTPYLARVLGPTGWAPVLLAQSLAALVALLVEFGFDLTGTQQLAQAPTDRARGEVIAGVLSARLVLLPAAGALALVGAAAIPALHADWGLVSWGLAAAVTRGASPLWVFQGIGRPEGAVLAEVAAKVAAALGVLLFVHGPHDGWRVLALQAGAGAISVGWLLRRARGLVPWPPLSRLSAGHALHAAWPVFAFRGAGASYLHANVLILGALADPITVTMYASADRLVRAGINLFAPLTQALFPRVSRAMREGSAAAGRARQEAVQLVGGTGVGLSLLFVVGASPLVRMLLGPGYDAAVPLVRGLAALPTLIGIGTVLGIHWAIPSGRQRVFLRIVVLAGLANLAVATLLVPTWGAWGMVVATTTAEAWVAGALLTLYRRSDPA
jgi:polysaccharide transporter, PST family